MGLRIWVTSLVSESEYKREMEEGQGRNIDAILTLEKYKPLENEVHETKNGSCFPNMEIVEHPVTPKVI